MEIPTNKIIILIFVTLIIILTLMGPHLNPEHFDVTCSIPCAEDEQCVPYNDRDKGAYGTCRKKVGTYCWLDSDCAYNEACLQAYDEDTYGVMGKCREIGYKWVPLYDGRGATHFNENNRINPTGPI